MLDVNDVQLDEPNDEYPFGGSTALKAENWQFVKDHQMYAIATKEELPVYTNVWVGANHDVIVGDMKLGLFTFSKKGDFDSTCLLPASLINLFTSIPEGSTISKVGKNYVLNISTDSYSLITEFTPKYEDDESVGSYNSEIILGKAVHPEKYITVDVGPILKFIRQSAIFKEAELDKVLEFKVADGKLTLINKSNSCTVDATPGLTYELKFNMDLLKNVISNVDSDRLNIAPIYSENQVPVGCMFWTDNLTTILSGVSV
jgi:hypothetical protein